jgi:hypothetical protein
MSERQPDNSPALLNRIVFFVLFLLFLSACSVQVEEQPKPEEIVFCTQDVMECPDGSFVSRMPPDCEFAKCQSG